MAKAKASTKGATKAQGKTKTSGKGKGKAAPKRSKGKAKAQQGNGPSIGVMGQLCLAYLQRHKHTTKAPVTSRAIVLGLGRTPGQKGGQPVINALNRLQNAGLVTKVGNANYRGYTWALTPQGAKYNAGSVQLPKPKTS